MHLVFRLKLKDGRRLDCLEQSKMTCRRRFYHLLHRFGKHQLNVNSSFIISKRIPSHQASQHVLSRFFFLHLFSKWMELLLKSSLCVYSIISHLSSHLSHLDDALLNRLLVVSPYLHRVFEMHLKYIAISFILFSAAVQDNQLLYLNINIYI